MNGIRQSTADNLWRLWSLANDLWFRNFKFSSSDFWRTLNLRFENWEEFNTDSFVEAQKFLLRKFHALRGH